MIFARVAALTGDGLPVASFFESMLHSWVMTVVMAFLIWVLAISLLTRSYWVLALCIIILSEGTFLGKFVQIVGWH